MPSERKRLIRLTAPYFCCGAEVSRNDTITKAAPIISYMVGWSLDKVRSYCQRKQWTLEELNG